METIEANISCADRQTLEDKVRLAVYDFDGTCINGNSPVLLVRYLMRHRLLKMPNSLRIGSWALRYKFQLPQNESLVRGLVFRPFCGKPAGEVDAYLEDFYDEVVAPRWRVQADESMRGRADEGCIVMLVSATWDAIARRAMGFHPVDHVVATRMVVDHSGNYTCRVDGLPIEGETKLSAIRDFANERFGDGQWEISYAYGDHHSDAALLSAAQNAFAVNPDKPLARLARIHAWEVLNWR